MRNSRRGNMVMAESDNSVAHRQKFSKMSHNESSDFVEELSFRLSNTSPTPVSPDDIESAVRNPFGSDPPFDSSSSWDQQPTSPLSKSPWQSHVAMPQSDSYSYTGLMGSLVREEGHIYSLAASDDLLYTGSDSKNIRVWKHQKEFSGFKSNSGLVKAIVIASDKIFSGHQDGKIRVWKVSGKNSSVYKKVVTMPTLKAVVKSSMNPSNYVETRKNRNAVWIKHFDAISCLSLSEDQSLLYSASWDKTIKVWRVANSKCLESINAHDDAVNSVVSGFDGLVFTGSADGTVKVWRRELQGKGTKHFFSQTLLKQECAVTALAINPSASVLYAGSSDGLVNYWDRDELLHHGGVVRGHKLAVLCLAAAGNLLFSGSADTNICVWRREGREHSCLSVLTGHSGPVKCLAVEGDREHGGGGGGGGEPRWIVYSGSLDKSVKIWRVSEQMPPSPPVQNQQTPQQYQQEGSNRPSVQSFASQGSRMSRGRK